MWHSLSVEEVIKTLKTDPQKGISEKEVKKRQQKLGINKLPEENLYQVLKYF